PRCASISSASSIPRRSRIGGRSGAAAESELRAGRLLEFPGVAVQVLDEQLGAGHDAAGWQLAELDTQLAKALAERLQVLQEPGGVAAGGRDRRLGPRPSVLVVLDQMELDRVAGIAQPVAWADDTWPRQYLEAKNLGIELERRLRVLDWDALVQRAQELGAHELPLLNYCARI